MKLGTGGLNLDEAKKRGKWPQVAMVTVGKNMPDCWSIPLGYLVTIETGLATEIMAKSHLCDKATKQVLNRSQDTRHDHDKGECKQTGTCHKLRWQDSIAAIFVVHKLFVSFMNTHHNRPKSLILHSRNRVDCNAYHYCCECRDEVQ